MGDRVGIALVGAGSIAGYHLGGLAATERASVRVVVARSRERAASVAARFGAPDATADLDAALARADVDAVVVATPDDTHEAIALAAIAAGKAVLVQKPMAPDAAGCRRLIAAACAAGIDLQASFMHRSFPEVVHARRLLAEDAIGRVTALRVRNATPGPDWGDWFFDPARVGGGVVHQLGVHGIDLLLHLAGAIDAVSARTATLVPRRRLADGREVAVGNPDSAWAVYELAGGAMASHEMSMIEPAGTDRFRVEIQGTEGAIWLRSERGTCAVHAPRALGRDGWHVPELPAEPFGRRQHALWLDGLTGAAPREGTAEDALAGLLVAEAVLRSATRGGAREAVAPARRETVEAPA